MNRNNCSTLFICEKILIYQQYSIQLVNYRPWGMSVVNGIIVTICKVDDLDMLLTMSKIVFLLHKSAFHVVSSAALWYGIFISYFHNYILTSAGMWDTGCWYLLANLLLRTFSRQVVALSLYEIWKIFAFIIYYLHSIPKS